MCAAMKTRRSTLLAVALSCALVAPALAQTQEQPANPPADPNQAPPPPPPPAEGQTAQPSEAPPAEAPAETPPAAEAPPPEEGAKSIEDRVADLEGKVEGISEPFSAIQSDVANLKRIKLSGYIQGRYEWKDDADRFLVRRGRVKTTYVGDLSEFVLQIDATGDGVALRDAEASFHLTNDNPWMPSATPWELKLTMGQFKVPFGFEVLQSSGDREMMERTAVIRALFPGERDRGFRLQYTYDFFKLQAAIINGNFTTGDPHGAFDQSSWKDIAARVGIDLDLVNAGVSVHQGRFLRQTRPASMAMPVAGYDRFKRLRLGGDAQLYFDIPSVGGLTLRGEAIWSRDEQMSFGGVEPAADHCKDADRFGWYATLVQNVGDVFAVAFRFDQYDPTSSLPDECATMSVITAADRDKQSNLGVALLAYISGNLKATLAYDHFGEEEGSKKDNDALTVQLQAKF
jgi:Phosphate-selective porin O and P